MRHTGIIALASALTLLAGACGKKDDAKATESGGGGASGGKSGPACAEANDVKVSWNAKEMYAPSAFSHTHTLGFLSGMVYNGKTTGKIGYVVLANYDVKLGPYMIDPPKEKGQQAILLQFKTASVATEMKTQKSEYKKLQLAKGAFEPSWMGKEGGFQVTYFVGGESGGPGITNSDAKGTAALTETNGFLCGSIDFTSPKGSTMKGTFNTKIQKDLWAK